MVGRILGGSVLGGLAAVAVALAFLVGPSAVGAYPTDRYLVDEPTPLVGMVLRVAPADDPSGPDDSRARDMGCEGTGSTYHACPAVLGGLAGFPSASESMEALLAAPSATGEATQPPRRPPRTPIVTTA